MTDLSKSWPFGLNRRTALPYLLGFVVLIALFTCSIGRCPHGVGLPQGVHDGLEHHPLGGGVGLDPSTPPSSAG